MFFAISFAALSAIAAGGLGLAAALRAGRSASRWAFAVGMGLFAAESALVGLAAYAETSAEFRRWQEWRFAAFAVIPAAWLAFSARYGRGRSWPLGLRQWGVIAFATLAGFAAVFARARLFGRSTETFVQGVSDLRLTALGLVVCVLGIVAAVLTVLNLERTFRASVGTTRWRIKFMVLGVAALFIARIYTGSQMLAFHSVDVALDSINSSALLVATLLILRGFFRAGHFELDVYPSQSVLQGSVTIFVAGAYLVIVGVLAKAVANLGGDDAFALKAFIVLLLLVALAVGVQSDRARLRLRQFISRHFERPLYDYRTVWQKFTAATASRMDETALARALAECVAEVFQALSVSVWILNEGKETLNRTATTSGGAASRTSGISPINSLPAAEIVPPLESLAAPVDLENTAQPWAAALRRGHPAEFPEGGHRIAVPLINRGVLIGLIMVGDRVGGVPFSLQDFAMLKCLGDQAAASLMNVRLAQQLAHARELEAFQAMAAFFVHDFKNAASTLTLTLQNLPVHFDNPEFRADALRGIAKSAEHINHLIRRLSALRHELSIQPVASDLNELIEQALLGVAHTGGPMFVKETTPLPPVPLDREQFNKVVTNLLLNAAEAAPSDHGRVRVATNRENAWVVLTVADNGCGMSDEFMHQSLFRPFQTTKQNGLGIGMFQSRMIVEAHGGRITVASRPGHGTTFQVYLRAAAPHTS